jgi:hypothetical protein
MAHYYMFGEEDYVEKTYCRNNFTDLGIQI